jgi:hypothetical protein
MKRKDHTGDPRCAKVLIFATPSVFSLSEAPHGEAGRYLPAEVAARLRPTVSPMHRSGGWPLAE